MTIKQIIAQLRSLRGDAEEHREKDGMLDEVFKRDIEALNYAIKSTERNSVMQLIFISAGMIAGMFIAAAGLVCLIVRDNRKED